MCDFYRPSSAGNMSLYAAQVSPLSQDILVQRRTHFDKDAYDIISYCSIFVLSPGDGGCIDKCCHSSSGPTIYHELVQVLLYATNKHSTLSTRHQSLYLLRYFTLFYHYLYTRLIFSSWQCVCINTVSTMNVCNIETVHCKYTLYNLVYYLFNLL